MATAGFALPDLPQVKNADADYIPPAIPLAIPLERTESTVSDMGKEFQKFGEEVAHRVDKIVSKRGFQLGGDPWTIQGIPIIFPSANNGFSLGLHTKIDNIRRQDPHKVEIMAQVLASDRARYKHFLQLDLPYAFGGGYRFTTRLSYNRDISMHYYGMSNETSVDRTLLENNSPYYKSVQAGPSITASFFKYFGSHWRIGPIVGFKWMEIEAPQGSLLLQERPLGIGGGRTHYVGLAFVHDTLDFEPYPRKGGTNELYLAAYSPLLGNDYRFIRGTYTYRRYIPLHSTLVLAHRTLVEALGGDVPYYEMNAVGGSDSTIGFGGDRFMRGFDGNRFVDQLKTVTGFELRWDPIHFSFADQDLYLGFVPFVEMGRVWHRFTPLSLGIWHASTGWGTRLIWNRRLIVRGDFAINQEGTSFYIELGHSF